MHAYVHVCAGVYFIGISEKRPNKIDFQKQRTLLMN